VPAIQNHLIVRARLAVAPARPAAEIAAFAGLIWVFAAAAPERRLSIAIIHGRLVSRVPDNGNFGRLKRHLTAPLG